MNAGTAFLDRRAGTLAAGLSTPWAGAEAVVTRPAAPPAAPPAPAFPATSLARIWLPELRAENRLRRVGGRLGFGLLAAGGVAGVLHLALSTLDFTAHWSDFAGLVAGVFS